jgi:hypothetical protein
VNCSSVLRRVLVGATLVVVLWPLAAEAQSSRTKAPPQLPPNPSQSSQIPAGVDTGSPTTSNNMELGTPVPPDPSQDRGDQRTRSAAARAAARPDPLTRTGVPLAPAQPLVGAAVKRDASRPAGVAPSSTATRVATSTGSCAADADPAFRQAMAQCTGLIDRSARSACADRAMSARSGCP